jgi:hypothetical protein
MSDTPLPPGREFWAEQWRATLDPDYKRALHARKDALRTRQRKLTLLLGEMEANGYTEEEGAAYDKALALWTNEVLDLAEETNTPLHDLKAPSRTAPLEGSRRTGKGGLSNP